MRWAILLAAILLQACASKPQKFSETDVMGVPGFKLKTVTDVRQSGGILHSGSLMYSGKGELREVFRDYVASMTRQGWTTTYTNIAAEKASATLRKDRRICYLEFTAPEENKVHGTIRVVESEAESN